MDRIGIVDYPTRRAFFDMQRRDDFKAQHEHKEAGMEFTIVMGTEPVATGTGSAASASSGIHPLHGLWLLLPSTSSVPGSGESGRTPVAIRVACLARISSSI